jgi:hypothetical protein
MLTTYSKTSVFIYGLKTFKFYYRHLKVRYHINIVKKNVNETQFNNPM